MTPEIRKLLARVRAWVGRRPTPEEVPQLHQLLDDVSAALEGQEGEGNKRRLSDYQWKNCTHGDGEPVPAWLTCKACVLAWAALKETP